LEPNARYLVTIERKEKIGEQSLWDVPSEFSGTVEGPRDWSEEHFEQAGFRVLLREDM